MRVLVLGLGLCLTAAGCATVADPHVGHTMAAPAPMASFESLPVPRPDVSVPIMGPKGDHLGFLTMREGPVGVLMRLEIKPQGLTPGWHGVHFHAIGDCSDEKFQKSGPHVGHGMGKAHGLLHPQGPEWGDLPNLFAPSEGSFGTEMFSSFVTLRAAQGASGRADLMDKDGSALVIHANLDDQISQPIGGAGARVACAVIAAPKP
jgi:superoxide dismutase, Cu-Zn family